MAKKTPKLEGEEHASTPAEEAAPAEEATAEAAPAEAVEEAVVEEAAEEIVDEVIEEPVTVEDTVTIKLLQKNTIRGADGHQIHTGQEGKVVSHLADALVGRGQAEIV